MDMIRATHDLHHRRRGRNAGIGLLLGGFVALVFAITLVKLSTGQSLEAFDHTIRPTLDPAVQEAMRAAGGGQ